MTDLYLIAHRVRGEPAFDVAQRIECPECRGGAIQRGYANYTTGEYEPSGCNECDSLGYWWIIGTSGHRAYPWWSQELTHGFSIEDILNEIPIPDGLQDHYITQAAPARSLTDLLNLRPKPVAPILRRI